MVRLHTKKEQTVSKSKWDIIFEDGELDDEPTLQTSLDHITQD